jgi:antitoxin MazE
LTVWPLLSIFIVDTTVETTMQTQVSRWGNSLGLRIPRAYALEAQIEEGTQVTVTVEEGRLIVTPVRPARLSLEELLAGITPENCHRETDWGAPRGNEVW